MHDSKSRGLHGTGKDAHSVATELTRRRYDRVAPVYDALEWVMEARVRRWRTELWSRVPPGRVLELGVGTGKNIRHHPAGREIVALDISEKMLLRARGKAERSGGRVAFELSDAQRLPHPDATFDVVVASFVFCSVPDPRLGLRETRRVLRPGGKLLLLEHVLSRKPVLRSLMRWLDPVPFHVWGAHIDRDTVASVRDAGFTGTVEDDLSLDIVKLIEAEAPPTHGLTREQLRD